MMGVLACVVTGSLTWDDILGERTGWDILIGWALWLAWQAY